MSADIVIEEARKRLEVNINPTMRVERVGGDEYIILTRSKDFNEVENIVKAIIKDASKVIKVKGYDVLFTMSLGVVKVVSDSMKHEELLELGRMAMYDAKKSGRNCFKLLEHKS